MPYCVGGIGAGEITINPRRYHLSREDLPSLMKTIQQFKQVKSVVIDDNGWIFIEADLAQLTGSKLDHALSVLHARIVRAVEHKATAVASTK